MDLKGYQGNGIYTCDDFRYYIFQHRPASQYQLKYENRQNPNTPDGEIYYEVTAMSRPTQQYPDGVFTGITYKFDTIPQNYIKIRSC